MRGALYYFLSARPPPCAWRRPASHIGFHTQLNQARPMTVTKNCRTVGRTPGSVAWTINIQQVKEPSH